jgi:ribose 5-phosphate isomerase B
MKIFLGTDHAGFDLKETVKSYLVKEGYEVVDCGAYAFDKEDDYPEFIGRAAKGVSGDRASLGIVMGGSGQGEAMAANKYKGIRCALFYAPAPTASAIDASGKKSDDPFEMVRLTREHNDANMLSLGGRFLKAEEAIAAVRIFLETGFTRKERHMRRIAMIERIANSE